jgi:hypothetical protein
VKQGDKRIKATNKATQMGSRLWGAEGRRCLHEANLSTQAAEAEKSARFPEADEHEKRP